MRNYTILAVFMLLSACADYSLVSPGATRVGALALSPEIAWNKAAQSRAGSEIWTQDGQALNTLTFIQGIPDGKPIFKVSRVRQFGPFRKNMLPNEIMELTESSLSKLVNSAVISTENLKAVKFGGQPGFQFNFRYTDNSDVPVRGLAAGTVKNGKLYMILYTAAELYYYDKGLKEAERLLTTAKVM